MQDLVVGFVFLFVAKGLSVQPPGARGTDDAIGLFAANPANRHGFRCHETLLQDLAPACREQPRAGGRRQASRYLHVSYHDVVNKPDAFVCATRQVLHRRSRPRRHIFQIHPPRTKLTVIVVSTSTGWPLSSVG